MWEVIRGVVKPRSLEEMYKEYPYVYVYQPWNGFISSIIFSKYNREDAKIINEINTITRRYIQIIEYNVAYKQFYYKLISPEIILESEEVSSYEELIAKILFYNI